MWGICAPHAGAQEARSDTLQTETGVELALAAGDLLRNDDSGGGPVLLEVVSGPRHGTLTVVEDSLVYRPDMGYIGPDSLIYRFSTVPEAVMTVDTAASSLTFQVDLTLPNVGTASDEEQLFIEGTVAAAAWPDRAPFDSLQVRGLDLQNSAAATLDFNYGDLGLTVLTVTLDAAAGGIRLSLPHPGAAVVPGFAGLFEQAGNEVGVAGQVGVTGSGPLGGLVPTGDQQFDTSLTTELAGLLGPGVGGEERLILNVDLQESVDLSGNTADLHITGEIVAMGDIPASAVSNEATVYLSVVAPVSVAVPESLPDLAVYPNPTAGRVWLAALPVELAIVDVLGRERGRIPAASRSADLSALPAGVYFLVGPGLPAVKVVRR